jgi:hypothetical protein
MTHNLRIRRPAVLLAALVACSLAACAHAGSPAPSIVIVDRPVPFSANRVELTRVYIREHYGLDVADIRIVPKIIVLHWTAVPTFQGSYNAFIHDTIPGDRANLAAVGALNVGIQFLVDRDGTIYRLMPETWMARHVIGLNYNSIGVENVGGSRDAPDLTPAQVTANIRLVRYLAHEYPTIHYLIGHYEYRQFEGHPLWLERNAGYRTGKTDPGPAFMAAVRAAVTDLHLEGPPNAAPAKAATGGGARR